MVTLLDFRQFFKGIFSANQNFQFGNRLILFQVCLYNSVEEPHVSLQRNTSGLEAASCSSLFPCETSVGYLKEFFLKEELETSWRQAHFFQICVFHSLEETHVTLQRETFSLEAGTSST
jgi:hypothetical protein